MKIGFVLDDTLDSNDGVQQYVRLLGGWMSKHGHEVHYLVGESKRTDIDNLHSLSKNFRVSFNKNTMTIPLPVKTGPIKQLLQNELFDVLHVQMPFSPMLAAKIINHRPLTTACVATFHIAPHSSLVANANKLLAFLQTSISRQINSIVSVSKVAQSFALEAYKVKSDIVPNAIDTKAWKPPKQYTPSTHTIVFIGRLVKRKGVIILLQALKQLIDSGQTDCTLIIAGDGPERKKLEQFVRINNLDSYVQFLGFVSEEKKKQILQTATVAVYPASGGESFGIVLLEAMAAGTVVLAGSNPGYASVLAADCPGALFNPHKHHELAQKISSVLNDTSKRQALYKIQQNTLKRFDINIVGNAILMVYKQAIKRTKESYVKTG